MHSPENSFWSLVTLTTEILRHLEAKVVGEMSVETSLLLKEVWIPQASFKMFSFFFPDTPLLIADLVASCQIYVNQTFHAKSAFISLTKEKCNSAGINFQYFCLGKQDSSSIWSADLPCKHFLQFFWCPSAHSFWPLLLCSSAVPSGHSYINLCYTAPSPVHELDFLLWQIMFLFYVTRAAFDISREKYVDPSLATPALSYCYITFEEDTGAFFPRNSTTFTHPKNSDLHI